MTENTKYTEMLPGDCKTVPLSDMNDFARLVNATADETYSVTVTREPTNNEHYDANVRNHKIRMAHCEIIQKHDLQGDKRL